MNMEDEILAAVVAVCNKHKGVEAVENCGTVYITDTDGKNYAVSVQECDNGEEA